MTWTTRTRRTTTRTRVFLLAFASVVAVAQKKQEPYAIVGGSVFHESGLALPGAKVVLSAKERPEKKLQEQVSSPRGEFAFRVPPGPAIYLITASLKGFQTASREVEIEAQEQIHKTLLLVPASK